MPAIALAVVSALVLSGALGVFLLLRHAAAVAAHRESVPADFKGEISIEQHQRAAAYTSARAHLGIAKTVFDTILAALWLTVLLWPLYFLVAQFTAPGISRSVAIVVAFALIERLFHLPFSIFRTFWLEANFGFNRATPLIFIRDRIKGLTISFVLGVPLLYGFFWLPGFIPDFWWLAAWVGFIILAIAMSLIIPAFIDPLFNKFSPMPNGPLRESIEALLGKCGFASNGLYVMDASRRSTHGALARLFMLNTPPGGLASKERHDGRAPYRCHGHRRGESAPALARGLCGAEGGDPLAPPLAWHQAARG